jgi:cysteine desulfuration protein SufE
MIPAALQEIIDFFEPLPEAERRENLIHYAEAACLQARKPGLIYDLQEVRKDQECSDTVGVFLYLDGEGCVQFAIELGPKIQTLTKALATILCRGLNGSLPNEILAVSSDFVPRIVGTDLVRLRSQTIYYLLGRMQTAVRALMIQTCL